MRRDSGQHGIDNPYGRGEGQEVRPSQLRVLIHQPLGSAAGQATDIEIHAKEILKLKELVRDHLKHTGKRAATVAADIERDRFMTAKEAISYGIIDNILKARPRGPEVGCQPMPRKGSKKARTRRSCAPSAAGARKTQRPHSGA